MTSGHGGKLLAEMDTYAPDKIFMLHAATERTIAIYNHKGWKVRVRLGWRRKEH